MSLDWFNVRDAAAVGTSLADRLAPPADAGKPPAPGFSDQGKAWQALLERADPEIRALRLNFFKRARLANSFKWRLLENGVDKGIADELTQSLLMHLLVGRAVTTAPAGGEAPAADKPAPGRADARALLAQGNNLFKSGDFEGALSAYEAVLDARPRDADALNNVGATLCKLSRHAEAEDLFRRAIKLRADYPEALSNLGVVLQSKGLYRESEAVLRRALKARPAYVDARSLLGLTLALMGKLPEAAAQLDKVLRVAPRHLDAMVARSQVSAMSGQFEEAEGWVKRALEVAPDSASAMACLPGLRRMTAGDAAWAAHAMTLLKGPVPLTEAAALRFALGKYHDDIGSYDAAFEHYREGNEILRTLTEGYHPESHAQFVEDIIRVQSREVISAAARSGSASERPVFIVGMLRSGTTLLEQIIASHPRAAGAGELPFWSDFGRKHEAAIRAGQLDAELIGRAAEAYLKELDRFGTEAIRVVDKAPVNSDYVGLLHAAFPKARIIHMRRDPVDTCLSCYFQQLSPAFGYTRDLGDLAHYYRQHHRLMQHWHAVLPAGVILDVRYEQLVADQAGETRKILDFLGLEWSDRCLQFHQSHRAVITASTWQVRQPLYNRSVQRWQHYRRHLGPVASLKNLGS